ncbi:hypothetical protein VPNG_00460 [Cytospora leucostoma]|uniref:Uncharacterized protein n=1 Tax=Cytospora leucostoma TaxID=1230097 RepID=A0A423XPH6_9PEZI|nr:hypothetical protein VPNG_00460 [Cytospora leucostoma]
MAGGYKRLENRKYNQDEINYVISRVQANWDADTIAKAFKQDHAQYWGDREFTKKQVNYIRSTYKLPWGAVATYNGPMPQFSQSPTVGPSAGPASSAQQQGQQLAEMLMAASPQAQGSIFQPAGFFPTSDAHYQQPQAAGAAIAGPSNHGQNPFRPDATGMMSMISGLNDTDVVPWQQPSYIGATAYLDPFADLDQSDEDPDLALGDADLDSFDMNEFFDFDAASSDLTAPVQQDLGASGVGPEANASAQNEAIKQAVEDSSVYHGFEGFGANMGNTIAGVSGQEDLGDNTLSAFGVGPGANLDAVLGQSANVAIANDLLANLLQSQKRKRPATDLGTGRGTAPNIPGHQQPAQSVQLAQSPQLAQSAQSLQPAQSLQQVELAQASQASYAPQAAQAMPVQQPGVTLQVFPPGCTEDGALDYDLYGRWYGDPHDSCQIPLRHRHDFDGGIHFRNELSVAQTLLAMHKKEGIGFLLGLGAAQRLQPHDDPQQMADLAHMTVPAEFGAQTEVTAPGPEIFAQVPEINRKLPANHHWEPYTKRVVRYNLPADISLDGEKRNVAGNQSASKGAGGASNESAQ